MEKILKINKRTPMFIPESRVRPVFLIYVCFVLSTVTKHQMGNSKFHPISRSSTVNETCVDLELIMYMYFKL